MAPRINLYSSLACEDYYSERSNLGLPGPLPGGAYPVIDIGHQNPNCHIPEVYSPIHGKTHFRFKRERLGSLLVSIYVVELLAPLLPADMAHSLIDAVDGSSL